MGREHGWLRDYQDRVRKDRNMKQCGDCERRARRGLMYCAECLALRKAGERSGGGLRFAPVTYTDAEEARISLEGNA